MYKTNCPKSDHRSNLLEIMTGLDASGLSEILKLLAVNQHP